MLLCGLILLCGYDDPSIGTNELPAVRIKDLATLSGIRSNQLMGIGLIVGLKGTGDSSLVFTDKALTNLLTNLGGSPQKTLYKSKNVAAVIVTAELPPFMRPGQKIDVFVSSVGDASSLKDGTLLITPLKGPDDKIYAVAQGPVVLGGKDAASGMTSKKSENVCKVIEGAILEQEVPMNFVEKNRILLVLKNPDFTTAMRIASTLEKGGFANAKALDPSSVEIPITVDDKDNIVEFIARIEDYSVVPDNIARVVINSRTGTVVIGDNVRLTPVALSHGDLEIKIDAAEEAKANSDIQAMLLAQSQTGQANPDQQATDTTGTAAIEEAPAAAAPQTAPVRTRQVAATAKKDSKTKTKGPSVLHLKTGASLSSLVKALNSIGTTPEDLVAIIQALKSAGSLSAEVEVI